MDVKSLILYEDNHLLALNKPAGILVQGDRTKDPTILDFTKNYIKVEYNKPGAVYLGLIHRLDRPVSGVVLLAKTSKALARMNAKFQQRQIKKYYYALCEKPPAVESGLLVHWLKKNNKENRTTAYKREVTGAKRAELEYELKMVLERRCLLEILPVTGRPHQIRVQLSNMGCTIIGDTKYGFRGSGTGSIALHARAVHFEHPVKKEPLVIEAPVPDNQFWKPFKSVLNG